MLSLQSEADACHLGTQSFKTIIQKCFDHRLNSERPKEQMLVTSIILKLNVHKGINSGKRVSIMCVKFILLIQIYAHLGVPSGAMLY